MFESFCLCTVMNKAGAILVSALKPFPQQIDTDQKTQASLKGLT